MPVATAPDGVRIHYEIEGDGPPLVLQHGLLSSLESWRQRGYVERFAPKYQCILVDSRGHGESDKPDDPEAYELRTRVVDIASVCMTPVLRPPTTWAIRWADGSGTASRSTCPSDFAR